MRSKLSRSIIQAKRSGSSIPEPQSTLSVGNSLQPNYPADARIRESDLVDVFNIEDGALCKGLRRYKEVMQEAGRVEPNPEFEDRPRHRAVPKGGTMAVVLRS